MANPDRKAWTAPYTDAEERVRQCALDALEWAGGVIVDAHGKASGYVPDAYAILNDGPLLSRGGQSHGSPVTMTYFSGALKTLDHDGKITREIRGKRCFRIALKGATESQRTKDARVDMDAYRKREEAKAKAKEEKERAKAERAAQQAADAAEQERAAARTAPDADTSATADDRAAVAAYSPGDGSPEPGPVAPIPAAGSGPGMQLAFGGAGSEGWPDRPTPVPVPDDVDALAVALLQQVVGILANPTRQDAERRLGEQTAETQRLRDRLRDTAAELEAKVRENEALRVRVRHLEANVAAVLKAPRVDDRTRKELENLMRAPGAGSKALVVG